MVTYNSVEALKDAGDWEEVDLVEAGRHYGWPDMEGAHCFPIGSEACDESAGPNEVNDDGFTMPLAEYSHGGGRCSITGAGVYRSCQVPDWDDTPPLVDGMAAVPGSQISIVLPARVRDPSEQGRS